MNQGAISTFMAYYLWTTFKGIAEAIQVSNNVTLRDYWKSYNNVKGIFIISAAQREMSKSHMNGI
jgi:hypothetical protein